MGGIGGAPRLRGEQRGDARRAGGYTKTLAGWTQQLGLRVACFYRSGETSKRAVDIYLIALAPRSALSTFLQAAVSQRRSGGGGREATERRVDFGVVFAADSQEPVRTWLR